MTYRIQVEETGEISRNINIEIPREIYNKRYDAVVRTTVSQVAIKGFRPGHAPKAMVMKLFGERIHGDVLGELLNEAYRQAVEENNLRIVGEPKLNESKVDPDSKEDLKFTAEVAVFIDPTITGYDNISIEVEVESVTDETVEHALTHLIEERATFEPQTERTTVKKDDVLVIDFSANIGGEAFQGSEGKDVRVDLRSEGLPVGFAEGVVGQSIGEERTIAVTMPDKIQDEKLSGQAAEYKVRVTAIEEKKLPEMNNDFAKSTGLGESVDELRSALRSNLEKEAEKRNAQGKETKYFEALAEKNTFQIPQIMIDEEIRRILFEMRVLDSRKKESHQMDMSRFRETLGKGAEFRVRRGIMLSRIVEQEGFTVSDADVDTWLNEIVEKEKVSREQVNTWTGFPQHLDRLKENLAYEKMMKQLLEKSTVQEVSAKQEKPAKSEKRAKKKADK